MQRLRAMRERVDGASLSSLLGLLVMVWLAIVAQVSDWCYDILDALVGEQESDAGSASLLPNPAAATSDESRGGVQVQASGSNRHGSVVGKPKFYAVRQGRTPGMYFSWADCAREVVGFKGCEHKSFSSLVEAEEYLFRSKIF